MIIGDRNVPYKNYKREDSIELFSKILLTLVQENYLYSQIFSRNLSIRECVLGIPSRFRNVNVAVPR